MRLSHHLVRLARVKSAAHAMIVFRAGTRVGVLRFKLPQPLTRKFAGRSSCRKSDTAIKLEESVSDTRSGGPAAAAASQIRDAGQVADSSSGSTSSAQGVSDTGSVVSPASNAPRPGLFALPFYKKPAFPGFYQVVQINEQEVLDFLFELRKTGKGDHLGGFLTTKAPDDVDKEESVPLSITGGPNSVKTHGQILRRDAGSVSNASELEEVGTLLSVVNMHQYPNVAGGSVVVMPKGRIRRTRVVSEPTPNVPLPCVNFENLPEPKADDLGDNAKALHMEIISSMQELLKTSFIYKDQFEQVVKFYDTDHPVKLADLVAGMSLARRAELQAVLAETDLEERLNLVLMVVKKDLEMAKLQSKVKSQVEEKVTKEQKRIMLMEQMKQIKKELGIENDDKHSLATQFQEAIKDKILPEEANKVVEAEMAKLQTLEPSSSEFNVCRTYLEWLTCLPWSKVDPENTNIAKAEAILNEDHFGLDDVKERILEHIAVSFLKGSVQGKIMCLVGPPGVGKTSIGKSIARALDRKFFRFSVGGMHDVAELRGHRRTYVGAMPGKLIQCFKNTQTSNPVVLIDEIDKLGRDYRGDPSSAFLEILDPEQNNTFRDHYLDVPVDLSKVLFVCTANTADTIPGPLLDRMEVIRIAGYVFEEKVAIANQYLIPQTSESSGVGTDKFELDSDALEKMISDYAREAGVRHLRQLLEKVNRKVALSLVRRTGTIEEATSVVETTDKLVEEAENASSDKAVVAPEDEKARITVDNLSKYIGQPLHYSERMFEFGRTPPGVVVGLAWTSLGGTTLFVEVRGRLPRTPASLHGGLPIQHQDGDGTVSESRSPPEDAGGAQGHMKVTGQLGNVMNESSSISLTYARLFVRELKANNMFLDEAHLHLHVPEGATPKDGPSAGVTMASALVSLALDRPLKPNLAMTGELTLTGKILKVGGIKEKVIGARREGITTLILPKHNEADYSEMKEYLRAGLTAHFVDHFDDVYRLAFDQEQVKALPFPPRGLPVVSVSTPLSPTCTDDSPRPISDSTDDKTDPSSEVPSMPGSGSEDSVRKPTANASEGNS